MDFKQQRNALTFRETRSENHSPMSESLCMTSAESKVETQQGEGGGESARRGSVIHSTVTVLLALCPLSDCNVTRVRCGAHVKVCETIITPQWCVSLKNTQKLNMHMYCLCRVAVFYQLFQVRNTWYAFI